MTITFGMSGYLESKKETVPGDFGFLFFLLIRVNWRLSVSLVLLFFLLSIGVLGKKYIFYMDRREKGKGRKKQ
jgi:hypothetical protein